MKKYETGPRDIVFRRMVLWAIEGVDSMIDALTPPPYIKMPEGRREEIDSHKALKRDFERMGKIGKMGGQN